MQHELEDVLSGLQDFPWNFPSFAHCDIFDKLHERV